MTTSAGLWGPVTATVDWCETNYALSPLVAEPFNTVSSLAMVGFGLAGVWRYRHALPARILAAFGLLAVVGAGSIAFHATLRFELQLLDELPMLWLVLLIVWILGSDRFPGRAFPAALAGWGLVLSALDAFPSGKVQFWAFQLGFGSLELFSLAAVFHRQREAEAPVRRLFRAGMSCYALGIAAWFVDLRFCALVGQGPQLHAVWHVLVSVGFYALLLVIALTSSRSPSPSASSSSAAPA